jgi:hypothetical protein
MQAYAKLIAAVVGVLILLGQRHGLNLAGQEQVLVEGAIALATAFSVWYLPNKPVQQ